MKILSLLAVFATAASALAQESPRFGEVIEVRRAEVEVVVTDPKGNPVAGLQPSDFFLFEGGEEVEITNFSEVRDDRIITPTGTRTRGAQSSAAPERRIVIFVDNSSIGPIERNRILESARGMIDSFGRNDLVMIVSWNRGMKLEIPFTSSREELHTTLERMRKQSGGASMDDAGKRMIRARIEGELSTALLMRTPIAEAYSKAITHARNYGQEIEKRQVNLVEGLRSMIATLAGTSGRKAVVFLGRSLPQYPGLENFLYADEVFRPYLATTNGQMEGTRFPQTNLHAELARYANASDVAFYPIFVNGQSAESAENQERISHQIEFANFTNTASSMQMLASMTGGTALQGTENYGLAFAFVRRDLGSYYSIAWKPMGSAGEDRPVEVRTKNPNLQVRVRTTHREKSLDEQMTDRLVANLFHTPEGMKARANILTGTPKRQRRGQFAVPMTVRVPVEAVTLLPQGDGLAGEFCVWVVVANERFEQSEPVTQCQPVEVSAPAQLSRRAHWTYDMQLLVREGTNIVSVAVHDLPTGEVAYARTIIDARR